MLFFIKFSFTQNKFELNLNSSGYKKFNNQENIEIFYKIQKERKNIYYLYFIYLNANYDADYIAIKTKKNDYFLFEKVSFGEFNYEDKTFVNNGYLITKQNFKQIISGKISELQILYTVGCKDEFGCLCYKFLSLHFNEFDLKVSN